MMNRFMYVSYAFTLCATSIAGQSVSSPNIVLILCDDMGFFSLSLRIREEVVLHVLPC